MSSTAWSVSLFCNRKLEWSVGEGRTVSSEHEGDEEPCSGSEEVVGVEGSHDDVEDDKDDSCCHGGVVFIGFPASMVC